MVSIDLNRKTEARYSCFENSDGDFNLDPTFRNQSNYPTQ